MCGPNAFHSSKGGMAYTHVGVVSVPVSFGLEGMAFVLATPNKRGVTYVHVSPNKGCGFCACQSEGRGH